MKILTKMKEIIATQAPTRENRDGDRFARVLKLCAIYLLVVSLIVVPVTFSKYVATSSGGAELDIATFDVSYIAKRNGVTLDWSTGSSIKPGDTLTYSFAVKNDSNVAIQYTVEATNITNNITPLIVTGASGVISMGVTDTVTCTIEWPSTAADPQYCGMSDIISFTITVIQKD